MLRQLDKIRDKADEIEKEWEEFLQTHQELNEKAMKLALENQELKDRIRELEKGD